MSLDTTKTWYWSIGRAFPLAGVSEAPLVAAALAEVDAGRLAMGERVGFNAQDLSPPFSAIDQRWPSPPDGYSAQVPASTLMILALQRGDNTASDVLMKRIGGPGSVTAWLQQQMIADLHIDRYQRELLVELCGMPTFRPDWKDPAAFNAVPRSGPGPRPPERHGRLSGRSARHGHPAGRASVPG